MMNNQFDHLVWKRFKDISEGLLSMILTIAILLFFAWLFYQHQNWVDQNCKIKNISYPIEKMLTEQSGNFLDYSTDYYIVIADRSFRVNREQFAKWHEGDQITVTQTYCPYWFVPDTSIEPNF